MQVNVACESIQQRMLTLQRNSIEDFISVNLNNFKSENTIDTLSTTLLSH